MLNSWLTSKSSRHSQRSNPTPVDNAQSDASSHSQSTVGPLRTPGNLTSASDVPLDEVHTHINDPSVYTSTTNPSLTRSAENATADHLQRGSAPQVTVSAPKRPDETPFTPQDALLAQVLGRTVPPTSDPPAPQHTVSLMTSDSLPPPPSSVRTAAPSSSIRLGPTLPIYEPFSGVKLGERTTRSPSMTVLAESSSVAPTDDRKLWSSLERILELQAEIAAMHADMEGVGARGPANAPTGVGAGESNNVGPRKGSRRSETLLVGDEEAEEQEPLVASTGPAVSEISTEHSNDEEEDEDERQGEGMQGYSKKRRDEEFSKLAEQFAQRKVAIGGIMNKLDDLSTAIKTFHVLPPPLLDLAMVPSRTDTVSSTPSNMSATSSSPRVYFGQPSVFPSQPTNSTSPPVPPISTLVSPESALPGFVSPVLSRTNVPTIRGASFVDSPAEMDPIQSITRR